MRTWRVRRETPSPPPPLMVDCSDVVDCVKEKTFPLNSTIKQDLVMEEGMWSSNMASLYYGMCHTFIFPHKVEANQLTTISSSLFYLEPSLNYRVILHDPQFYHILLKHGIFPRIWLEYKSGQNMKAGFYEYNEITVTQHHLLNRPEQPCEEEEDYDFLKCVKTSQARMVGCRPPWDIWSPHTIPLCQTMEQLQEYEELDLNYLTYEKRKILIDSGCKGPCNYKVMFLFSKYLLDIIFQEYKMVAGRPQSGSFTSHAGELTDR